jgi:cell division transport system ATP-binding protein
MLQKKKTEDVISFHKVCLSFGPENQVFSNLDLSIPKGSFHFLTGPSGAGKSTFLKMLYLSQQQTAGSISLFSRNTLHITHTEVPHIRRKIGVVFQDFRLIPGLNALDNVALPLRVRGVETRKARKQAAELLEWVGLEDAMHRTPLTLSGGQQQRTAIARAVIGRPQILLADEPTGNVDDEIALKLLHLFEELHKIGTTVIVATHNRSLPHAFQHPEIFLDQGKASLILPAKVG